MQWLHWQQQYLYTQYRKQVFLGNSTFEMQGGSLTAKNGGMFYTTNTESTFTLKDVDITNADDSEFFLKCTGNSNQRGWGTSGSNGADCLFTAISQKMNGDIIWDSISQLDLYMTEGSSLKGTVVQDESCAGNGGSGYSSIYIDKDSTWTVTGDSTVTNLYNAGTIQDASGKVTSTNLNNIAAVSEDQAEKLAQKVMKAGESKGFIGIYRYAKAAQSDGTLIAFTDCNKALDTFYKNVRISGLVSLAGVVAVFVLVVIFSRLVFRPIAESYQKQKQFITDASHEIKTPLTIIDANVEVIEMMSGENKWTKSTKNQVKRLASLAGQLITLSKMDEGDGMADKMRFSMTDAVIDATSSFESVAETKGRKLVCDIEENLYFVGEEKRIREMFGIFLDNAVKYSTEGSEIHVSLERKGRKIIYQISNETDQIAKGNQDVLFERFYRSDASRNSATGGSGIGLSVAKAVAEAHHGKLTAESKDGKSLTITLTVGPAA